jgi:hypothetical protein
MEASEAIRQRLGFIVQAIDAGQFKEPGDAADAILGVVLSIHPTHRAQLLEVVAQREVPVETVATEKEKGGDEEGQEITFTTHSDDCASIVGRNNIDESSLWGHWWPLIVDDQPVGLVKVDYGDGWEFTLKALPGHAIDVDDNLAYLPDEEHPWWDDADD